MKPKLNAQPNKSLIDGITTLQALATSPDPVGCRELARRLDIDPIKVNRLLKTLAYLGIARQTADRKYTAGPGMHVLAAQSLFASGLIRRALRSHGRARRALAGQRELPVSRATRDRSFARAGTHRPVAGDDQRHRRRAVVRV